MSIDERLREILIDVYTVGGEIGLDADNKAITEIKKVIAEEVTGVFRWAVSDGYIESSASPACQFYRNELLSKLGVSDDRI